MNLTDVSGQSCKQNLITNVGGANKSEEGRNTKSENVNVFVEVCYFLATAKCIVKPSVRYALNLYWVKSFG